ncbi:MAG: hypothetical protein GX446_11825 [Chthonomonadales bacterium]|nr:hypothetical protein [Chthonomonadales bacterium]
MRAARLIAASVVVALAIAGCGGGGGGGGGLGPVSIAEKAVGGSVSLPAGYGVAADTLRVVTSVGESPVKPDATFTARVYNEGLQLTRIVGPGGKTALLGWLGGGHTEISARSTAEVLVYFGLGAYGHRGSVRRYAIETISQRAEVAAVESAIVTALLADPEAIGNGSTAVTDAVLAAVAAIRGDSGSSGTLARGRGILIDPSDTRSGITPTQDGNKSLNITNAYRRRAWAFIDRVSYVPAAGGDAVPSPAKVTDFEIPPTASTSGLIGTFVDIMYGNNAYAQITSGPHDLPLSPADAKQTTYRLTVVGAGIGAGDEGKLTEEQIRKWRWVVGKTIVRDFVLPITLNIVMNLTGDQIDDALDFIAGSAVLADFINTLLVSAPDIWVLAAAGDNSGACWAAYNAIMNSGTLKLAFFDLIRMAFKDIRDANAFFDHYMSVMNVLALGDVILTAVDSVVQGTQIALSNRADVWDVTVNQSKAKLTPATSHIMVGERVALHAALPDATGGTNPPVLAYHWKCTGTVGRLTDGMHTGSEFDSSSADATFESTGNREGTDTVTVEIFERTGGQSVSQGTASATVSVKGTSQAPTIVPRRVSVFPGDTQTFSVRLDKTNLGNAKVTYVWTPPGTYGMLTQGQTRIETESDTMTYQARVGNEGSDSVRVEAFVYRDGKKESLGAATASIAVEKRKSIVMGRFLVETRVYPDDGRFSIGAYVIIPKVDGAERYSVNCYGFYDWAYYGSWLSLSKPPDNRWEDHGGEFWQAVSGLQGDGSGDPAAENWYRRRFAGMVVEVTVTYAN